MLFLPALRRPVGVISLAAVLGRLHPHQFSTEQHDYCMTVNTRPSGERNTPSGERGLIRFNLLSQLCLSFAANRQRQRLSLLELCPCDICEVRCEWPAPAAPIRQPVRREGTHLRAKRDTRLCRIVATPERRTLALVDRNALDVRRRNECQGRERGRATEPLLGR
jgi:hypothetical protein